MSDSRYLLLLSQEGKSFKPIQEKLKGLDAFYTGIGYAAPQKNEDLLRQLVDSLPNVKILPMPLSEGQNFESFKLSHKAIYYQDLLIETDGKLLYYKQLFNFEEITEEAVASVKNLTDKQKEEVIDLLYKKDKLQKQIDWAKGMEKALQAQQAFKISIKFICDQEINYLLDEAPEMPRLVNFLEGEKQSPFIPKGIVAQLVGAGGVGKTHALTQLALSIATGSNWLGVYPIEKAGYVFMCLGENKDADIHRLLRKIVKCQMSSPEAKFFSADPLQEAAKRISVMSCTGRNATFITEGSRTSFYEELLQALKDSEPKEGWSLIILDPISRFFGADAETDNAAATQVIALLERITLELKGQPTLIFGHHMNKSGVSSTNTDQGAARGSSAITDGVRWQANLEKTEKASTEGQNGKTFELNQVTLRAVKSNFTAIFPAQKLIKDQNGCLRAEDNKILTPPRKK